jgi:Transcriptional regulators
LSTIKDVASDAGVSIATVSYVLNNTKNVSDETRAAVENSIKKLGYNTNSVARNLRSRVSMNIGVVLQNVNDIFFSEVLLGIEESLKSNGFGIVFANTGHNLDEEQAAIQRLRSLWVDGIILDSCVTLDSEDKYIQFLKKTDVKRIPIVMLENSMNNRMSAVLVDNLRAGMDATSHLISLGCRHILHISYTRSICMTEQRRAGYESAMREAGLGDMIRIEFSDMTESGGYFIMKKLLRYGLEFDGVFAANDRMAAGVIQAYKESGIKVPDEVKVVGFDNIALFEMFDPPLTTIDIPKYQLGYKVAEMLIRKIKNDNTQITTEQLNTRLVVRRSTDSHIPINKSPFLGN